MYGLAPQDRAVILHPFVGNHPACGEGGIVGDRGPAHLHVQPLGPLDPGKKLFGILPDLVPADVQQAEVIHILHRIQGNQSGHVAVERKTLVVAGKFLRDFHRHLLRKRLHPFLALILIPLIPEVAAGRKQKDNNGNDQPPLSSFRFLLFLRQARGHRSGGSRRRDHRRGRRGGDGVQHHCGVGIAIRRHGPLVDHLQRAKELGTALEPLGGIFCRGLSQKRHHSVGNAGHEPPRIGQGFVQDLADDFGVVCRGFLSSRKGLATGQHFKEGNAQRVDIGTMIDLAAAHLLRGHILRRSQPLLRARFPLLPRKLRDAAGGNAHAEGAGKSVSFGSSSGPIRIFPGLMSRWIMPCSCRWWTARRIPRM